MPSPSLPSKMRRATGIPSSFTRISTYEETDILGGESQSLVTLRARKSSSPSALRRISREKRETSPQVPTPYQSKKHLSISSSSGDVAENARHLSGSQRTSSSSSINQMSGNESDGTYESVTDYIKTSSSIPVPQPGNGHGDVDSGKNITQSSSFNAPSYPAPIPPKKSRMRSKKSEAEDGVVAKATREEGERRVGCVDDDDDDDDGYEPIKLDGGQVEFQSYTDEVERAQLPLLSSPSPWSSVTGDSNQSSPVCINEFRKSPSGLSESGSFPRSSRLSTSPHEGRLNEGASRYIANVKSGQALMPPEPTSPPPSPPKGGEQEMLPPAVPITIKSPSPLLDKKNTTAMTVMDSNEEEQPKLPRKKRGTRPSISTPKSCEEDLYAFDTLVTSATPKQGRLVTQANISSLDNTEVVTSKSADQTSVLLQPQKSQVSQFKSYSVPTPSFFDEEDENVYEFDSLSKPPEIPKKSDFASVKREKRSSYDLSSSKQTSSVAKVNNSLSKESPPSTLSKPEQSVLRQLHDDQDIYSFDSLQPQAKSQRQPSPRKLDSRGGEEGMSQKHDNKEIYSFDYLDSRLQSGIRTETRGVSSESISPETGQTRKLDVTQGSLIQSSAPPNKPPPNLEELRVRGGGERASGPTLPPKSSPPMLQKRTQGVSCF